MSESTARDLAQRQSKRLYTLVSSDEEDAQLCADIPDSACKVVPGNFMRHKAVTYEKPHVARRGRQIAKHVVCSPSMPAGHARAHQWTSSSVPG